MMDFLSRSSIIYIKMIFCFEASIDVNRAIRGMVQLMIIGYFAPTIANVVISVYEIGKKQRCARLA